MFACLKNWIKHLRRQRSCVFTSTYQSAASSSAKLVASSSSKSAASSSASSFSWARISIKFSPNRSKSNQKNSGQAEAKAGGIWQSFWLNGASNEAGFFFFEHWLTGNSAGMARAWPYYFSRLLNILIADLSWKLLIGCCLSIVAAFVTCRQVGAFNVVDIMLMLQSDSYLNAIYLVMGTSSNFRAFSALAWLLFD